MAKKRKKKKINSVIYAGYELQVVWPVIYELADPTELFDESFKMICKTISKVTVTTAEIISGIMEHIRFIYETPICQEDMDYPHKCFECGNVLHWSYLTLVNSKYDIKYLKKLWESKNVQFYCCTCNIRLIYKP